MKRIIVLEPNVANKIAAGEVIERPASVVKELVENSIDAGSTAVTVEIRNGGVDYIRVTDNGGGIDEIDVPTAFLRHATGKIATAEELNRIETFGFRGEALASVAAVSKVSMRTRTANADSGTHIEIEGGKQTVLEQCGCPCGTTIEVNTLFYNVPARLKFLKSARSEAALIGDYLLRLILSNPDTSIKFINNGKTVYHSFGDGSLENALFCVYDRSIIAKLYKVSYDDGYVKLTGFTGSEATARSSRSHQSVFVNKRYIKSPGISLAVQRAYDTRLMNGKYPFFVLNITVSPYEIDVNVHPNKLSIRFKDEERISLSVTSAVQAAFTGKTARNTAEEEKIAVSVATAAGSGGGYSEPDRKGSCGTLYAVFNKDACEAAAAKTSAKAEPKVEPKAEPKAESKAEPKAVVKPEQSQSSKHETAYDTGKNPENMSNPEAQSKGEQSGKPVESCDPLLKVASEFDRLLETDTDWSLKDSEGGVWSSETALSSRISHTDFTGTNTDEETAVSTGAAELISKFKLKTDADVEKNSAAVKTASPKKPNEDIKVKAVPVIKLNTAERQEYKIQRPEQIEIGNIPYTVVGVAFDTYIIIQQGEAIYFIDQHAAHERMLYEKFISNEIRFDSQQLLIPENIKLDAVSLACVKDNAAKFAEIGFSLEFIDDTSLKVYAVPSIIACDAESFILEAVDFITEKGDVNEKDLVRSRLIQLSCKRAVKAGDRLEAEEIESILQAYSHGKTPLNCPHGRPVIIKLSKTDLEKMFKRIV